MTYDKRLTAFAFALCAPAFALGCGSNGSDAHGAGGKAGSSGLGGTGGFGGGSAGKCGGGKSPCAGGCVDLKSDPANCGTCGKACAPNQVCNVGVCAAGCPTGKDACSNACVDLKADPQNCGKCGVTCPADQFCSDGLCADSCFGGTSPCAGACVDESSDPANCGTCGNACGPKEVCSIGKCGTSKIEHVLVIVEENHSFDSYFGKYCTAPPGSNPSCTEGPGCCEAAPNIEPAGASPLVLDDAGNLENDRNHAQKCELAQMDNGLMDHFVTGSGVSTGVTEPPCSVDRNWALADFATMNTYWATADLFSLADRYFQPIAGSTSSNDMYLAIAHYQFTDNTYRPDPLGTGCVSPTGTAVLWSGRTTIADLLVSNGFTFTVYADGYAAAQAAGKFPNCAALPPDCPFSIANLLQNPSCRYDPSDIPFQYYSQFADSQSIQDFGQLQTDITNGNLPNFAYVKARTYRNEHPGYSVISDGVNFVSSVIDMIQVSQYSANTLILLTWDEGGGFFDHVAPPPPVAVQYDQDDAGQPVPYGTRIPTLAIGTFARPGAISHVQMEHSSIVRFLEYNFLGPSAVGALGHRDAVVNNIGSLLDPTRTGITIPEGK